MKKLFIVLLVLLFSFSSDLKATHYMGGEITWECTFAGNYKFTMKLYRECYTNTGSAAGNFPDSIYLKTTVPGFDSIKMIRLPGYPIDVSPICNSDTSFPHIYCNNSNPMQGATANLGAIQEHIYTSAAAFPNGVPLSGVPPTGGWLFHYSSFARNPSTNISGMQSFRLRSKMNPYNNQNVSTCYDNSPSFSEIPEAVICSAYPFRYNHLTLDKEHDSLVYSWGQPLNSAGNLLANYVSGYSWNSPLPGSLQNPNNVPATIDPVTGEILFTSFTSGAFVASTKITSYKCGVNVAEIWRDMQFTIRSCGTNNQPNIAPPFKDSSGQYTLFVDTVYAGDLVCFNISATDYDFLSNGTPQTVTMDAFGSRFGNIVNTTPPSMSATSGCLNPPCATLSPAPFPPNNPLSGISGVQTQFCWQTTCSHLTTYIGCWWIGNVYDFVVKVSDDYCPIPSVSLATITIVVMPPPSLDAPEIHCVKVNSNGNVTLNWVIPQDTMQAFYRYIIEYSGSPSGPFMMLDSIYNYTQNTYTHIGANAHNQAVYYRTRTSSGCYGKLTTSAASSVYSTMKINAFNTGGLANVSWNPIISANLPSSSGIYNVFRENPAGSGQWTQIATTSDTSYIDTVPECIAVLNYKVEIEDTLGFTTLGAPIFCSSVSSIDGDLFSDIMPPSKPIIDSLSVNPLTDKAMLSWDLNPAPDCIGYIIYRWNLGMWMQIDTLYGNNTTFEDSVANPCLNYQTYAISAFDSCHNNSIIGVLKYNTIKVEAKNDYYQPDVYLNWNPYINMSTGLGGYKIYYSENSGPLTYLTTVSASDTSYKHIGVNNLSNYCYLVRAFDISGQKTSTSCEECILVITSINSKENHGFLLSQNIPNPTNKTTTINYFLPKSGNAVFKVVNIVGEQLYSKEYDSQQGENKIELDISNFESGVYYYSLEFDGILKVKKMVVLK
ncbi:MAG: T9SS type A sorting domain-containing protein [Saprospiraceae bacterium]|nr:T9SS type A sorting domain-containing protein [Saprospiraceae bacterium]